MKRNSLIQANVRSLLLAASVIAASFLGSGTALASSPVNINKADASMLAQQLEGIGPVKAKAIVEHRNLNGSFSATDELLAVDGIGDALFKRIQPYLLLSADSQVSADSNVAAEGSSPALKP